MSWGAQSNVPNERLVKAMALAIEKGRMMHHEHGPSCGHLAIHHFCKGGKQHIGFVEDSGGLSCYLLSAPDCESSALTCLGTCVGVLQKLVGTQCSELVFPEDEDSRVDTFLKCNKHDNPVKHRQHFDHLLKLDSDTFTYHHIESRGKVFLGKYYIPTTFFS